MAQQGPDSSHNGGAQGPHSGQLLLPRPRSAPGGDSAGVSFSWSIPSWRRCGLASYCELRVEGLHKVSSLAGLDSLPEQPAHEKVMDGQGDQDDDRGGGGGSGSGGGGSTGAGAGGSMGRDRGAPSSTEQQDAERNDRAVHHRRLFEASRQHATDIPWLRIRCAAQAALAGAAASLAALC